MQEDPPTPHPRHGGYCTEETSVWGGDLWRLCGEEYRGAGCKVTLPCCNLPLFSDLLWTCLLPLWTLSLFSCLLYMPKSILMLALVCLGSSVFCTLGLASEPAKVIWILKTLAQHLCIIMHVPWLFLTGHIQFPGKNWTSVNSITILNMLLATSLGFFTLHFSPLSFDVLPAQAGHFKLLQAALCTFRLIRPNS